MWLSLAMKEFINKFSSYLTFLSTNRVDQGTGGIKYVVPC